MTNYGFRLFRATIYRNGRGEPYGIQLRDKEPKLHFRDFLFELAMSRKGAVVHGSPHTLATDDVDEVDGETDDSSDEGAASVASRDGSRPVLVIQEVSYRGDHVVIDYLYGRHLGYTWAGYSEVSGDDPAAPPIDIAALKSVRPYRAAFMFPEVGNAGVVAVEDASRTHASKKLEQWLRHWSREDAEAVAAAQREQTGKKSIRAEWWSMRLTPMSDPERLKRLMLNGTSSKIVLTKQGASDSNTPGKSPLKVEMGLDDGKYAKQARMLINKWIAHFNGPPAERASDPQGAATRDLAAVLADRYMGFDDEAYDDAWIEVKDSDGKKKEISPSRWADIFIYPVGSGIECPSRAIFFGRVQKAVAPLEKSLEVKIDWAGWGVDDG